jgi:hypothetical protein
MFTARVKLPASGEPVSATGLPVLSVTGVGTTATGVIVGRSLVTFCGVSTEVAAAVGGSTTGGSTVGSVALATGLTTATGLDVGGKLDGDGVLLGDGDGLADATAVTATDPDAAGSAARAGLTAASAAAVSVTDVTDELALAGTVIWACIW